MTPTYDILMSGNSLRLRHDFLGISSVTLIHGKSGPILFDTGGFTSRFGLLEALASRGMRPSDIPTVFLSHLHHDHSYNVDLFPHARFVLSKQEWDYAASPHVADLLVPWGIREQLSKSPVELVEGEGQLDAGVDFFPAPGHTPGSLAVALRTADRGEVVLAGDALKYPKEAILRRCDMAFDTIEAGTATINSILHRSDRIVPGHFTELVRQPDGAFSWPDHTDLHFLIR